MPFPLSDTFAGVDGDLLSTYSAEWVVPSYSAADSRISLEMAYGGSGAVVYYDEAPSSADYEVSIVTRWRSTNITSSSAAAVGRLSTSAQTFYMARLSRATGTTANWQLFKLVNGTATQLGSNVSQAIETGIDYTCTLRMVGSTIELYKQGEATPTISVVDASITAAGFAGLRWVAANTSTAGAHVDTFSAESVSLSTSFDLSLTDATDTSAVEFSVPFSLALTDGPDASSVTLSTTATYLTEYEPLTNHAMGGPPRCAVFANDRFFISTVEDTTHNVVVSRLSGGTLTSAVIDTQGGAADIHNNASVAVDGQGHVCAVCTPHGSGSDLTFARSVSPYSIDFGSASAVTVDGLTYYPTLVWFADKLFLFVNHTSDRSIRYKTSTDYGATWSSWAGIFIPGSGGRAYFLVSVVDDELVVLTSQYNAEEVAFGGSSGYFLRSSDGVTWNDAGGTAYTLPTSTATAQVFFDSPAATANLGFFPECVKDSSGRYISYVHVYATEHKVFMCRFDTVAWSQTEIVHPSATWTGMPHPDPANPYAFHALASYSGTVHLCRAFSTDDGDTWQFTRLTDGAVSRARGATRRIFGATEDWVAYCDINRASSTTWTSDILLTFNSTAASELTASLSAVVQAARSISSSADLAVQQSLTASASLATAISLALSAQSALSAAVQAALTGTASADVAVQQASSAVASLETAVQLTRSIQTGADAVVQQARSATASLDSAVKQARIVAAALDAYVQAGATNVASLDVAVQAARSASASASAAVQVVRSESASLDAVVQQTVSLQASLDAYIQAGFELSAFLSAAVQAAQSASASIDTAVAVARSASASLGAAVAVRSLISSAMAAAVLETRGASAALTAYVLTDDPDELYPLAGLSEAFPLAGQSQTYPLQ